MSKQITIDRYDIQMDSTTFGIGGQGQVYLGHLASDPSIEVIVKEMSATGNIADRVDYLVDLSLHDHTKAFAAPFAYEDFGDGTVWHVAPYVQGVSLENDRPRSLPENLEIGLEFVSLLSILDDEGLSHGDIAMSNVLIDQDGTVSLIDWDGYVSDDPTSPSPNTLGQRPMLAPELRLGTATEPSIETDRFAIGVYLSILLTGRYPTDGLGDKPAEVDHYMTQGLWPEHQRNSVAGELPIEALGSEIMDLFDKAFSLDPQVRPTPEDWRLCLTKALNNCWIHDCGNAFVADANTSHCPSCHVSVQIKSGVPSLKITLHDDGHRYRAELKDGEAIIIGRANIPNLSPSVSGKHLEITRYGNKIHLRHIGRHDTLIQHNGQWHRLDKHWVIVDERVNSNVSVLLADVNILLTIE